MLNQLVEFGATLRNEGESDALKQEPVSVVVTIGEDGRFISINTIERKTVKAETITRTSGKKARLIVDTLEYALGFIDPEKAKKEKAPGKTEKDAHSKHTLYLQRLEEIKGVHAATPLMLFFFDNYSQGKDLLSQAMIEENIKRQDRSGNVTFLVLGDSLFLNEHSEILKYISEKGAAGSQGEQYPICSICQKTDSPLSDVLHLPVKNVPPTKTDQNGGKKLISYNLDSVESYGLKGNENSSICAACARNYVEGLNYLLGNGVMCQPEKGKPYFQYSNRKNLAPDTAMVYWTRSRAPVPELELLDNTAERHADIFSLIRASASTPARDEDMALLLDSPHRGNPTTLESVDADRFYACALSGAAARIAIRSWLETTAPAMKHNIAEWFQDTAIMERNFESKEMTARFFALRELAGACGTHRKKDQGASARYELDKDDPFIGRAATMLWNCALLGKVPPLTMLDRVVRRIKTEEGRVTAARAALLRLVLNRSTQWQTTGAQRMHTQLDQENTTTAYVAGRIFAMLESIQSAALGNDLNAPIRDRFFSFAATNPSPAFGRLLKLSQNHLGKLRGEKPGLAVNLDRKLGELFCKIKEFPPTFSLEEQGQFAIGYYHQRQDNFAGSKDTHTVDNVTTTGKGE